MDTSKILKVGFINIRGQTGLKLPKHLQIENFIRENCLDILHLQESNIEEDTFSNATLFVVINLLVNVKLGYIPNFTFLIYLFKFVWWLGGLCLGRCVNQL